MDVDQKTPDPLHVGDPNDLGDAWVWRAIAWPSRWRGVQHRSQPRREKEASVFFAHLTASTAGRPPCLTSDQLPASVAALIAHDSPPAPPPVTRGPGRPRQPSRRGCITQFLWRVAPMPVKGPPFVGLKDSLKGSVVFRTAQGQHVVGLLHIPPGA